VKRKVLALFIVTVLAALSLSIPTHAVADIDGPVEIRRMETPDPNYDCD